MDKTKLIKRKIDSYIFNKDLYGILKSEISNYLGSDVIQVFYKGTLITTIINKDNMYIESAGKLVKNSHFSHCISYDISVGMEEILKDITLSMEYIRVSELVIDKIIKESKNRINSVKTNNACYQFKISDTCECYLTLSPRGYIMEVLAHSLMLDEESLQTLDRISTQLQIDIILNTTNRSKYLDNSKFFN